MLRDHLTDDWSLDGLTTLVYGVPKKQAGLPLDVKPTDELKAAQRRFFVTALPAAGRRRHRPAPAHPAPRGRPGAGAAPARRLTQPPDSPGRPDHDDGYCGEGR